MAPHGHRTTPEYPNSGKASIRTRHLVRKGRPFGFVALCMTVWSLVCGREITKISISRGKALLDLHSNTTRTIV